MTPEELEEAQRQVKELREELHADAMILQEIVEHPETLDSWSPIEIAWFKEQLELQIQQLNDLRIRLHDAIERRRPM